MWPRQHSTTLVSMSTPPKRDTLFFTMRLRPAPGPFLVLVQSQVNAGYELVFPAGTPQLPRQPCCTHILSICGSRCHPSCPPNAFDAVESLRVAKERGDNPGVMGCHGSPCGSFDFHPEALPGDRAQLAQGDRPPFTGDRDLPPTPRRQG